jgi:membrane protease YdiL (CAAX protease family)
VALAEVGLCSGIPTQLAIAATLHAAGFSLMTPNGLSLPFVVALSLMDTVVLVALMVGLTLGRGESPRELWLGTRPVRREVALGVLLVPVVFLLVVVLLTVLRMTAPWLHNVPVNPLEQLATTPGGAAVFALVAILAGGVREELQRAFIFRRFERHLGGSGAGVIVMSVGFGLGHVMQGWDAVIGTAVLGCLWVLLYVRRRSVLAPMVSHAGFNAIEVLRVAVWGV